MIGYLVLLGLANVLGAMSTSFSLGAGGLHDRAERSRHPVTELTCARSTPDMRGT
jgi:hypothetical protein